MSYKLKDIFQKASKNVMNTALTDWSYYPKDRHPEIIKSKSGKKKKERGPLAKAFIEAGSTKGQMAKTYQDTLAMLTQASRNRPRFNQLNIGVRGAKAPGTAGFGTITEADFSKFRKENRDRMRDFLLQQTYTAKA
jgi:hypothetical protein